MFDLILHNAKVISMDNVFPKTELVAVESGRIVAVKANRIIHDLRKRKTEMIDCKGKTVIPGFIDAHCHLAAYAESLVSINMSPQEGIGSIGDMQNKIKSFCKDRPPGTWIRGKGFNDFHLKEKRHPNRHDLDMATSLYPIKLTHRSGHAHVLNGLALQLVGITKETGDPPDGLIDRDLDTGEPTGILYGMGGYLAKKIPPLDDEEMRHGIKLANEALLSYGITSIQDATSHNDLHHWNMFQRWKDEGIFKPRVSMMLGSKGFDEYRRQIYSVRAGESGPRIVGVKIIVHEITGSLQPSRKKLNEMVFEIHRTGLQAVLHAVEERTIEAACDAIEYSLKRYPKPDHRHRIEHCSVCSQGLAKRLHALGITVVTQPSFIYYSGDRYLETVPAEQLVHLYPIGTLMKSGIRVAASSDFPIAGPNPFTGIRAAITRMSEGGRPVLPEEGIGPMEALRIYTYEGARACFEENIKGSIEVGKHADLIILSDDPTKVSANAPPKPIKVDMTVLGGDIVWRR